MEFRQLEFFLAVAQGGSVTNAARNLHVAQPSLSQSLRRLEREVGATLFERVGRGMRITAAGEALLGPAKRIVREREDARAAVAAVAGLAGGRIKLASLPSLTVDPLPVMIGQFRAEYPLVRVTIAESQRVEEIVEQVEQGACDLGVASTPVHSGDVVVHEVGVQRLVLLVPSGYPASHGKVSLEEMATMPFVCGPVGGSSRTALEDAMVSAGLDLAIVVEAESTEAIVPLVVARNGVTLIPEGLAATAPRAGVEVRATEPEITRTTAFLHRPGMSSPPARAFVAMAAQLHP
ncbi:MAG: LysR family transcriptional regulator [Streptosporangiales bacterium]|nr:LysR family transcriptional regulator [Streptosporangiales bacterium]